MNKAKINDFLWTKVKQPMWYYSNKLVLNVRHSIGDKGKTMSAMKYYVPVILIRWGAIRLYEVLFGKYRIAWLNKNDRKREFKYDIGIVSISKNEGPYIAEWLEYHNLIGGGKIKFFFYDNESEDNTAEVVKPYIANGLMDYTLIRGKGKQLDAYNDALKKHKDECRWMAFIDMDEFLFVMKDGKTLLQTIEDVIGKSKPQASGIAVRWAVFGSSGLKTTPEGLTIENFLHRGDYNAPNNFHVKCIVNPRRVTDYISAHYPLLQYGAYCVAEYSLKRNYLFCSPDTPWRYIRINHYYSKSLEQYRKKISRGLGDRVGEYDTSKFKVFDRNEIYDDGMLKYVEPIKERLRKP